MTETHCVSILWKIQNFSFCEHQEFDACLESPQFYVNALSQSTWKLVIDPLRFFLENEVKVYLQNNHYNESSLLFIDYEISFLSADGSVLVTGKEQNTEIEAGSSYQISTYPTSDEVFESRNEEFLPQDTLTVQCRIWKSRRSLTYPLQYEARTRIGIERRYFHWAVEEFSQLKLDGTKRTHKIIVSEDQPTFSMELFLTADTASQVDVSIDIRRVSNSILKQFLKCKISVLGIKGNLFKSMDCCYWFPPGESIWNFPQFLTKNELTAMKAECLVGNVLNLAYDLTYMTHINYCDLESVSSLPPWMLNPTYDVSNTAHVSEGTVVESPVSEQSGDGSLAILQVDLLSLYKDKTLSDFELRTESESFLVHKCVLVSRSPIFKAMLLSDMKEKTADFVDIPDVDANTIERLLMFVYTGTVADLKCESAYKLYYAADKYEILSLKLKCSVFLAGNIAVNNVCEILLLADRHHDEELKSSVHDFILLNDDKVIHSIEWKHFMKLNSQLASETMYFLYSRKLAVLSGK